MASTVPDLLRALSDSALAGLLKLRPDTLTPLPRDSSALAARLAEGPPIGTVTPEAIRDPEATVGALVARGLLVAIAEDTVELPREVAYALRRDRPLGELHPAPPAPTTASKPARLIDNAGAGQVMDVVRQVDDLLAALAEEPAAALRTGGLGLRDPPRVGTPARGCQAGPAPPPGGAGAP